MKTNAILKLLKDEAGNVLALSAAGMLVLVALVGSALDLSVTYMARGKLQNACDAAVLAARQSMTGTEFNQDVEDEADRFFDFNFPEGTSGAEDVAFSITQNSSNQGELEGEASATIPTTLVRVIGIDDVDISVNCDAVQDTGHNDIVLVLDVTGSMNDAPSNGSGTKIERLREGTLGLYRALETDDGSITRYGIVPYSHTVNVARSLRNRDILVNQQHLGGSFTYNQCDTDGYYIWNCVSATSTTALPTGFYNRNRKYRYITDISEGTVHIRNSRWNNASGLYPGNRQGFRTSGEGCIEERPTIDPDNPAPSGEFIIRDYVTRADIDDMATNGRDTPRQFGRYDIDSQAGYSQTGCPSEASRLAEYDDETTFSTAINAATANVTGGTYHDVGMLWGARFASRTGFFEGNNFNRGDNVTEIDGVPVNTHIVFMTDGRLDTGDSLYSAHGVERYQDRTRGNGTQDEQHLARFAATCTLAREMGITIWVIALDVTDTDDIEACATSDSHFYTSDGSDLEEVFEAIGQGIGNLRLTR
ncbi:TadE/TadG family type IV pilus assembly protein [Aurantiacibacter sp. D1-12]|uniref:TadE/TadG family type IV pilus assembly protein n=1 Tax=Aurantiacibacter sp. D1-12 TaxID=2993658 RepID=UPI00237CB18C|nr:Tad domain-containing protein [Aurantiacibacter sp. D1-12]MDE1467685.1 pilus assembly protein TadG-related protein [Aurantiacibacter sp. D1-12]